ncbi:hypothetical protein [Methanoregula sp.]|uniref:hypothetical protein n=1 Tax=Methanoregula sp. TaxID=2052170 RepID=UPI003C768635
MATLPSQASGAPVPVSVTPPTAVTGTFPLVDDQVPPGQAHLLRLSAREDAGMQATITYLDSVNGSTGTLSPIHGDFVNCQENISRSITSADLRDDAPDLRRIAELFRGETDARFQEAGGNTETPGQAVQLGTSGNPAGTQAKDRYWETSMCPGLPD